MEHMDRLFVHFNTRRSAADVSHPITTSSENDAAPVSVTHMHQGRLCTHAHTHTHTQSHDAALVTVKAGSCACTRTHTYKHRTHLYVLFCTFVAHTHRTLFCQATCSTHSTHPPMLYVCSALRPLLCIKLCTLSCLYKHTQDTVLSGHLLDLLPRTLVKGDFAARPRELTESNVMKRERHKSRIAGARLVWAHCS